MLIEIIIAACVAFAAAGLGLLGSRILRRRLPKFGVIGLAAVAVIVCMTWIRYGWAERVRSAMPPEVHVIREIKAKRAFEPWTFIVPRVTALVAMDDSKTLRHPDHPGVVIVSLLHVERYAETLSLRVVVDCPRGRYAVLEQAPDFGANALPEDIPWRPGAEADDLISAACGRGEKTARQQDHVDIAPPPC